MKSDCKYIDGIGNISMMQGMVHFDLLVMQPPSDPAGKPNVVDTGHIVMSLPQYVRMCAELARNLDQLEAKGLITRKADSETG